MNEEQGILTFIRDYWVQLMFVVAVIAGWMNTKFSVNENTRDIRNLELRAEKLENKIEAKIDQQGQDIKNILIMLGEIKRNG